MSADDPLITLRELGVWARQDIDPTDTFAKLVIRMASALVREAAQQPAWTVETAPVVAKLYTSTLALRTYLNPPEGEVASGIGPLTSRLVDSVAESMSLTEEEREALAAYRPAASRSVGKRLWLLGPPVDEDTPVRTLSPDDGLTVYADPGDHGDHTQQHPITQQRPEAAPAVVVAVPRPTRERTRR